MGVVVVGRRARQDGVPVGRGAAELEPLQVLGVDGFVALQHPDGLVHGEPLPLTACRGRQSATEALQKKEALMLESISFNMLLCAVYSRKTWEIKLGSGM